MIPTRAQDLVTRLKGTEAKLNGAARYIHTSIALLQRKIKAAEEMGAAGIALDLDGMVDATLKEVEAILGNLTKVVSGPVAPEAAQPKSPRKIIRLGVGTATPVLVEVDQGKPEKKRKKKKFGL